MIISEIYNMDLSAFDDYQLYAEGTAVYPHKKELVGLLYVALGLSSEAGEVCGKIKKIIRDSNGEITDKHIEIIRAELGDVVWYTSQLCSELDIDFSEVCRENLLKLYDRKDRGVIQGSGDNR